MNNDFGIYEKSYHLIVDCIKRYPEVEKAVIFGSRATGDYEKGSDIDIALFGDKITSDIRAAISAMINEVLPIPYFVDVLDYKSIKNEDLKEEIDRTGKRIV
ncbi:MAG: nucleotidyltransferase family protein [Candidatus Kapaibacterium sp.]